MKAILYGDKEVVLPVRLKASSAAVTSEGAENSLLLEIGRLAGPEKMNATSEALAVFERALVELIQKDPKTYGADEYPASQRNAARTLTVPLRISFLRQTIETLRRESGYISVGGRWVHRAVVTFTAFGILVAGLVPLCAVSLLSDSKWGWLPGVTGIVAALGAGVWILTRVRSR